jgi:hypothetical protein
MRNAGWCDVPACGIADDWAITILAGEAATHIIRDVERGSSSRISFSVIALSANNPRAL